MLTVVITSATRSSPSLYRVSDIGCALAIGNPSYGETVNLYIDGRVSPIATLTYGA